MPLNWNFPAKIGPANRKQVIESRANRIYGPRKDAELQAHSMIDGWLQRQCGIPNRRKSNIADAKRKSIAE
jgi:hypothetical protein